MSYAKLRGRIKECYKTQASFAEDLGMDESTLSGKLNSKSDWTRTEIENACILLHIPIKHVHAYFFTEEVEKTQQVEQ